MKDKTRADVGRETTTSGCRTEEAARPRTAERETGAGPEDVDDRTGAEGAMALEERTDGHPRTLMEDEDDGGFQLSSDARRRERKKEIKQRRLQQRQVVGEDAEDDNQYDWNGRKFKAVPNDHYRTGFDVVEALARKHPELRLKVRPNIKREVIITALTEEATLFLTEITTLDGKAVQIEALHPEDRIRKWVVMRFPHGLEPTLLTQHPQVTEATRCTIKDWDLKTNVETRQVLMKANGSFPNDTIELGWYGKFKLRPYTPDPIRCYRWQKFGHHQKSCTKPYACAVYAGHHKTEDCFEKRKTESISAEVKCPNYSRNHKAWSTACPVRREAVRDRIEMQQKQQQQQLDKHQQQQRNREMYRLDDPSHFPEPPTSIQAPPTDIQVPATAKPPPSKKTFANATTQT